MWFLWSLKDDANDETDKGVNVEHLTDLSEKIDFKERQRKLKRVIACSADLNETQQLKYLQKLASLHALTRQWLSNDQIMMSETGLNAYVQIPFPILPWILAMKCNKLDANKTAAALQQLASEAVLRFGSKNIDKLISWFKTQIETNLFTVNEFHPIQMNEETFHWWKEKVALIQGQIIVDNEIISKVMQRYSRPQSGFVLFEKETWLPIEWHDDESLLFAICCSASNCTVMIVNNRNEQDLISWQKSALESWYENIADHITAATQSSLNLEQSTLSSASSSQSNSLNQTLQKQIKRQRAVSAASSNPVNVITNEAIYSARLKQSMSVLGLARRIQLQCNEWSGYHTLNKDILQHCVSTATTSSHAQMLEQINRSLQ